MEVGSRDRMVIGYTSTGNPIYDRYNHPEHECLTSGELQRPMFTALDRSFHHATEAKKHAPGSPGYIHHREQMLHHQSVYNHIRKIWSRALNREKKKPSTLK